MKIRSFSSALGWVLALIFLSSAISRPDSGYLYKGDPAASVIQDFTGPEPDGSLFSSNKAKVVELYSPHCGHCVAFKPEMVQKATSISQLHPELEFHAVSCMQHTDICRKFKVMGVPTLFVIPPGKHKDETTVAKIIDRRRLGWEGIQEILAKFPAEETLERDLDEQEDDVLDGSGDLHSDDKETGKEKTNTNDDSGDLHSEDEDKGEGEANSKGDSGDLHSDDDEDKGKEETKEDSGDLHSDDEEKGKEETNTKGDSGDTKGDSGDLQSNDDEDKGKKDIGTKDDEDDLSHKDDIIEEDSEEDDETMDREPSQDSSDVSEIFFEGPKAEKMEDFMRARAGAELARTKTRGMDKYNHQLQKERERVERRKKRLRFVPGTGKFEKEDPLVPNDGATTIMKANQVNTKEYDKRRKNYLDYMKKVKEKKKNIDFDPEAAERGETGKIAYEKQVSKPRLIEKLPVLKRAAKMTAEEELILDSTSAIEYGLEFNLFRSRNGLSPSKKEVLANWLDLLAVGLPPEWGVQSLVHDMKENLDSVSESYEKLKEVLERHKIRRAKWSRSCLKGPACGYWKLFHTITLGIAEHRGGLNLVDAKIRPTGTKIFSPLQAADGIRDYIQNFFYCDHCAEKFVEDYGDCDKNRRCDRLSSDTYFATDNDWKEVALWFWEVHNDVSVRLLNVQADAKFKKRQQAIIKRAPAGPGFAPAEDAIKVLWPTMNNCVACLHLDGTWNEAAVFAHLERAYWPGFDLDFDNVNSRLVHYFGDPESGSRLMAFLGIALLFLFYYMRQSLTSPQIQRTMLIAKSLGPAIPSKPKKRSA